MTNLDVGGKYVAGCVVGILRGVDGRGVVGLGHRESAFGPFGLQTAGHLGSDEPGVQANTVVRGVVVGRAVVVQRGSF